MSDFHIPAPAGIFAAPAPEPLEPWQQRLLEEKADLCRRLEALDKMVASPTFASLRVADQSLLRIQAKQMAALAVTLGARIELFA